MALRKRAQQKCMVCKWERKEGITDEDVEEKLIKQQINVRSFENRRNEACLLGSIKDEDI